MSPEERITPKTFYLNEQHELARAEKEGGGGIPKYTDINWAAKGTAINRSLTNARRQFQRSRDPLTANHYFLLAAPAKTLAKTSTDRRKAVDGKVFESTDFARQHSRVFRRLGVDLLSVEEDGSAVVHMKPETMMQLSARAQSLGELGAKEQSRWATIDRFGLIPPELRIDSEWLSTLAAKKLTDAVIEFQPLLGRSEIDALIRAIVSTLLRNLGEGVTAAGSDFSGRQWVRGKVTRESLGKISHDFFSVQSLHSPLVSKAAASVPSHSRERATGSIDAVVANLPTVAVVDTGVPADHPTLARYRRGSYAAPASMFVPGNDHASFVTSRAVFGDMDLSAGVSGRALAGSVSYYDVNVCGSAARDIDDKSVVNPALQAIVSTAPDVRVFNMSFDTEMPLDLISPVKRSEFLILVQDLDNFIFQNDVMVIVTAGNSALGEIPSTNYPRHFDDPRWALGAWARSFNSLTCGSFVGRLSAEGLVNHHRWPSPFCRVGPGLCDSPKPDFSANGGNAAPNYQFRPGLGVWGLDQSGRWEDRIGTSFAAPLLAREAALALQRLQRVCERGAQPFAVTAKAFLALTAIPPVKDEAVKDLSERTLGRGFATARRLDHPAAQTGVMIWQGVLEDEKDIARVQIPIPSDWLRDAAEPHLKLVLAWDPPVNAAVKHLWATRDVSVRLRMHPEAPAQRPSASKSHGSYPLLDRLYDLRKLPRDAGVEGDMWLIELSYEQIAAYHPAMIFPPQQRVAFAAELFDASDKPMSPQRALQSLTSTRTMNRLTVPPAAARLPVVLRTPV
jgi:hypothetical protein